MHSATAAEYEQAGFRILPVDPTTKRPQRGIEGFGAAASHWTTAARNFGPGDWPAILCGPCPALGEDWLLVLDCDHETTFADVDRAIGAPLPATLSSKGDKHRYYRVPPGELRDQIQQWNRALGRGPGAPELDLKWSGGYAIEPPGKWDVAFSVSAIAVLPDAWLRALLAQRALLTKNAPRRKDRGLPPARSEPIPMGAEPPAAAVAALASVWPQKEGRHDAALALGGWLSQSDWILEDVLRFAQAVFAAADVDNRIDQVRYSWENKRLDPDAHAFGLPTIATAAKANNPPVRAGAFDAAIRTVREHVPGMAPLATLDTEALLAAVYADNEQKIAMALALRNGTHAEVARDICRRFLPGTVCCEGKLWRRRPDGVWAEIPSAAVARLCAKYDGLIYNVTTSGYQQKYEAVHKPVYDWICQLRDKPTFFLSAPAGVPFTDGFLLLSGPRQGTQIPLRRARTRWSLPFAYEQGAAQRRKPWGWMKFLHSVWGEDKECVRLLHEILGYLLSGRLDAQKMFVFLGPTRAGKGVILHLLHDLFGDRSAALEINQLADRFSLHDLTGKTLAIDPDWRKPDPRAMGAIVARLLALAAGDKVQVFRKGLTSLPPQRLPVRVVLATNPPYGLVDAGGAIAGRTIILPFPRTFLGKEDLGLLERLRPELPAIVDLALAGLAGWQARGCRFTEPAAAADARETLAHIENPTLAFFEEECEFGAELECQCKLLYQNFTNWRETNGHTRMSSQTFADALRNRGVRRARSRTGDARERIYRGVRIRPRTEPAKLGLVPDMKQDGD